MSKVVEVQLEWKYEPEGFLEEPIQILRGGYELSISNGIALARIDPSFYNAHPEIKEDLTNLIESRLRAIQIMSHKDYTLRKPGRTDLTEDGKRNVFLEVEPMALKVSFGTVDITIRDKGGNIISDSKQERLQKQRWFAEAVDKYRSTDVTLDQMLRSYQKAVKDPDNELVHLYEIRDALSERFGGKKKALKHLGASLNEWAVLGDLANRAPLKEGRHRGKSAGALRQAEKEELEEARKAAANLIERYLIYLESR